MKLEEYQAFLREKRLSPFDGWRPEWGWVPKYQHVERLGSEEVEKLLNGEVEVQLKIDGANLTVCWDNSVGPIICSRNQVISKNEHPNSGFNGAIEYIYKHPHIIELSKQYIIRGEWLTRHTVTYNKDSYGHFYVFDLQRYEDFTYVSAKEYIPLLEEFDIKYAPQFARLEKPTLEKLTEYISGPDTLGAAQKEGVVIKRYDFKNKWGRTVWGKLVCADFKEQNKMAFRVTKNDPSEMAFAALVDDNLVLKTIHKIKDDNGIVRIQDMPQVLGRVWYDLFTDELWEFVTNNKVREFSFDQARRLVSARTREIALAYFNGVIN